jgi:hypothetical protein
MLNSESINWDAALIVHLPRKLVQCRAEDIQKSQSKLEVFLELVLTGWIVTEVADERYLQEGPKAIPPSVLSSPVVGMRCLLVADDIFRRGAPYIRLNSSEGYYKCLLRMKDLAILYARPDFELLRSQQFADLLKGKEIDMIEDAIGIEDDAVHDVPEPPAALVPTPVGVPGFAELASIRYEGMVVNYDRMTHTSGRQRGFIDCKQRTHGRCEKYAFCHHHRDYVEAAAWLFAWSQLGSGMLCCDLHYKAIPNNSDVQNIRSVLIATGVFVDVTD